MNKIIMKYVVNNIVTLIYLINLICFDGGGGLVLRSEYIYIYIFFFFLNIEETNI